jgi:cyclase
MTACRIIPCLDVDNGRVVKGVAFAGLRDVGDPVALARAYAGQGADELAFLDIGATWRSRGTLLDVVSRVAGAVFIPLTVGGGLGTVAGIERALRAGADKVSLGSAALADPRLLSRAAGRFGSQCVVLSVDARREGDSWRVYSHGGRRASPWEAVAWARRGEELGAGEILLNSIDRDGGGSGYDLELLERVTAAVSIPVIASGGAGALRHLAPAVRRGGASALLLASRLHDRRLTVRSIKNHLRKQGVNVR